MQEQVNTMQKAIFGATACLSVVSIAFFLLFAAGVTNTVIHGIFAFNNPDANAGVEDCWAVLGSATAMTAG